jgi:hypothetical protein
VLALGTWATGGQAQPVTTFGEVAGKYVGGSTGQTVIEIAPNGNFTAESPIGKAKGVGRIENGIVILPFSNNQGEMKFTRTGDVLEGPFVAGLRTGTTRVERQK